MKWRKATERLPDHHNPVCVRFMIINDQYHSDKGDITFGSGPYFYSSAFKNNYEEGYQKMYITFGRHSYLSNNVEWLDETDTEELDVLEELLEAIPGQTEDKDWWPGDLARAVEKAKKLIDNF